MSWRRELSRLRALFRRPKLADDLKAEIRSHLEMEERENLESGMAPDEAHYAALRRLGNVSLAEERSREMWIWSTVETLLQDLRYGLRQLRRSPGFAAVAVLTLALGIGANTAIFSVVDAVLLRMLPVRDPQQLVLVGVAGPRQSAPNFGMPYPAFEHFRDNNRVFSSMLAYGGIGLTVTLNGFSTKSNGALASGSYFGTLGVNAWTGRTLSPQDDSPASAAAVVLGYRYWRGRFGSDPSIIGKSVLLNRVPFSIVGVAPPGFSGLQLGADPEYYIPISFEPQLLPGSRRLQSGSTWWLTIMGRLRPGVSMSKAQANLNQLFPAFLRETAAEAPPNWPQSMKNAFMKQRIVLAPGSQGQSKFRERFRAPLLILMGIVILVLLVACTNVANLLLARAAARRREVAMRLALGAGQKRVTRQFLTESVMWASAGGFAGLAIAVCCTRLLRELFLRQAAFLDVQIDGRVVLFTAGISFLVGIAFGLAPALRTSREDPGMVLKGDDELVPSARPLRLSLAKALVILQVALSLVLLAGAGLLVRSLEGLEQVNTGFTRQEVLLFSVDPTEAGYAGTRLLNFYKQLKENLEALPGVRSVSFAYSSPLSRNESTTRISQFGTRLAEHERNWSYRDIVSPDYFATLGIRLVAGRDFTERDGAHAPKVAIINQTFVRDFFGSESPLGRKLGYGPGQSSGPVEIVGIAEDSKYNSLRERHVPMVYLPYQQFAAVASMTSELRLRAGVASPIDAVRREIDPAVPLTNVTTLEEQVSESLLPERLTVTLTSVFGLLALVLTAIGLYGVISHWASRRTHEIGVRMALGAQRGDVLRMVLNQGLVLALLGVGIGLAAALGLTRFLSSLLYGVGPTDPATLALVTLVLIVVALLGCYIPARRAAKVDPIVALRYE
jgi:predicted permease